jgi:hypothetical protein
MAKYCYTWDNAHKHAVFEVLRQLSIIKTAPKNSIKSSMIISPNRHFLSASSNNILANNAV